MKGFPTQAPRQRQLNGKCYSSPGGVGPSSAARTVTVCLDQFGESGLRALQLLAQDGTKPPELGIKFRGVLLPLGTQMLQQPHKALFLAWLMDSGRVVGQ